MRNSEAQYLANNALSSVATSVTRTAVLTTTAIIFLLSFFPTHASAQAGRTACVPGSGKENFPFCNVSLPIDDRVRDLISRIPNSVKPALLTARGPNPHDPSSRQALPHLGVPAYYWGQNCIHSSMFDRCTSNGTCSTSFPSGPSWAATFDRELMRQMAVVVGMETRAAFNTGKFLDNGGEGLGLECWGPVLNMNRDPRWGRNAEGGSEDPYLMGQLGSAWTVGLQRGDGREQRFMQVAATLKHFDANTLEDSDGYTRHTVTANLTRYLLTDYYWPAFRAAIKNNSSGSSSSSSSRFGSDGPHGSARGIMCSYNSISVDGRPGVPTCLDPLMRAARAQWGFGGYVTSDSDSVADAWKSHHYVPTGEEASCAAIKDGQCDIDSGNTFYENLAKGVADGHCSWSDVDGALFNSMRVRFELGLFDPTDDQPLWRLGEKDIGTPAAKVLNYKAATESLVLVANPPAPPLPLSTAASAAESSRSSRVKNHNKDNNNKNNKNNNKNNKNKNNKNNSSSSSSSSSNRRSSSNRGKIQIDSNHSGEGIGVKAAHSSNTKVLPLRAGARIAVLGPYADATMTLIQVDTGIICPGEKPNFDCVTSPLSAIMSLNEAAGGTTTYARGVDVVDPDTSGVDAAVDLAKAADAVVLGLGATECGSWMHAAGAIDCRGTGARGAALDAFAEAEAHDRTSIDLPPQQRTLADSVLKLGKPTVIFALSGGSVDFAPELAKGAALIQAFYPGAEGGKALADALFGRANAWGRMPWTMYPAVWAQKNSMLDHDVTHGRTYRYGSAKNATVAFGHGLSYTTFTMSSSTSSSSSSSSSSVGHGGVGHGGAGGNGDAAAAAAAAMASSGRVNSNMPALILHTDNVTGRIELEIEVRNTGPRPGDVVLAVYLEPNRVHSTITQYPERTLVDFARLGDIAPAAAARTAHFSLDHYALSLTAQNGDRVSAPGDYTIAVEDGAGGRLDYNLTLTGPLVTLEPFPVPSQ